MTGQKTDSNSRYRACFALSSSGSKLSQHQDVLEQINAVTKLPQTHVLEERSVCCMQAIPQSSWGTGLWCIFGCRAPKDTSQTSHIPPQNSSAAGASLSWGHGTASNKDWWKTPTECLCSSPNITFILDFQMVFSGLSEERNVVILNYANLKNKGVFLHMEGCLLCRGRDGHKVLVLPLLMQD